jgi:hypothetical protein
MKKAAIKSTKLNSKFDYRTITSFEKACEKEGIDPNALPELSMILEEFRKAIINVYKLFIIFKAINNGWVADYTKQNQRKYNPWLSVLSSGFGFVFSGYGCDGTRTAVGSRLCTYDPDVAIFIGNQFGVLGEEYKAFFLNA